MPKARDPFSTGPRQDFEISAKMPKILEKGPLHLNNPNQNPKPFIPSAEHRWGLARISTKKLWVGLTEREFSLLYEWVAKKNPSDWLMWMGGWPEWKPLASQEKTWNYHMPRFDEDSPQPPDMPRKVPK